MGLEEILLQPALEHSAKAHGKSTLLPVSLLLPSSSSLLGPLPDSSMLWSQKHQLLKQSKQACSLQSTKGVLTTFSEASKGSWKHSSLTPVSGRKGAAKLS